MKRIIVALILVAFTIGVAQAQVGIYRSGGAIKKEKKEHREKREREERERLEKELYEQQERERQNKLMEEKLEKERLKKEEREIKKKEKEEQNRISKEESEKKTKKEHREKRDCGNRKFEFGFSLTGGLATGDMKTQIPTTGSVMGNSQGLMGTQYIMNSSSDMLGTAFRFGYRIPINNSKYGEILPYVEINGFWNRPNKNMRKQYGKADNTYPHYINVPLHIGAQYRYPVTDIIKPYAEFGIGYDLLFISSEYGKIINAVDNYRYNAKGALSGNVGVGCFFSDLVSVGIYYYGFGLHKIILEESSAICISPLSDYADRRVQYYADIISWQYIPKPAYRDYGTVALRLNFHFGPRK